MIEFEWKKKVLDTTHCSTNAYKWKPNVHHHGLGPTDAHFRTSVCMYVECQTPLSMSGICLFGCDHDFNVIVFMPHQFLEPFLLDIIKLDPTSHHARSVFEFA